MTDNAGGGNAGDNAGAGGTGGSGNGAGGSGAGAGGAGAAGGGASPWHNGIDPAVIGYAQNKGWIDADPKVTFGKAIEAYRSAESKLGVPPDQLVRVPLPNAAPADLDAFWTRFGAVKEAKDFGLGAIKSAKGDALDARLAEAIATSAIAARAPKGAVLAVTGAVQKYIDGIVAEEETIATTNKNEQMAALKKNWGSNYENNLIDANRTFTKWAMAAGVDEAKAKQAIDAISHIGGVGAATVMEMLHALGRRMSEDRWIEMPRTGPSGMPQSQESAKARMAELRNDAAWVDRWSKGGVAEKAEYKKLLEVMTGQSSYAV
jgi:hypothetical protein